MIIKHSRYAPRYAWAPLALFVSAGGCSLWAGATLSDKPEELVGAGGSGAVAGAGVGGGTGGGGAVTAAIASSVSSSAVTVAAATSGSGGPGPSPSCDQDMADCDGDPKNGCEANLRNDPQNCGQCHVVCDPPGRCNGGNCR